MTLALLVLHAPHVQANCEFFFFQRTGGRHRCTAISIPKNSGLMFEMERWLEARKEFNGASWYRAEHKLVILMGAPDASSSGWGSLTRGPHPDVFRAGGDFPPALAVEHINVQEGYALQQTLCLSCADHPDDIAESTLVSDVDNKVLHDEFKRDREKITIMHATIIGLFWLQVRHDFALKLRWVSSAANADAGDISRPGSDGYVRLDEWMFCERYDWARDFDMDLMATPASVHKTWVLGRCIGTDLPFYSGCRTQGCAGVDVLSLNVKRMPTSQRECFGFCFPPTKYGRVAAAASRRMRDKGSGGASGSKAILVSPLSQRHCPG